MTQEIIEMWHKAWPDNGAFVRASAKDLEAFAKLVDAKATAKEREACAKMADHYSMHDQDTPADIAAAIRARGEA